MAASKDMGLVPSQRLDNNGLNSQLLFPDDSLRFNCGSATHQRRVGGDPGPKTRELTGFIDDKMFGVDREERYFHPPQASEYRRSIYGNAPERRDCPESQDWNGNGSARTPSGSDGSEEDDDDEEDDEDDVDEGGNGEVEGLVIMNCDIISNNNNNSNGSGSAHSSGAAADKIGNDASAAAVRSHSSFGSNREVMMKDGNIVQSVNHNTRESPGKNHQQLQASHYPNANVIAEPDGDMYYPQFMHGSEGSSLVQKDIVLENGRKDVSFFSEPGNSLKTILSDPLTGALMDDAMILPCGHSFGGGGIQHVLKMKACYTCSHSILEESVQPNLSLRAAVMAFRREEKLRSHRTSKRRREKFEDKGIFGDSSLVDASRGRGVQFPFAVTDRVVIKGNKRTPERFVGREAVVTTQCLNGWYVVKTLDNAESVKLQYRSLAKVADSPSSKPMSNKMTPNWL